MTKLYDMTKKRIIINPHVLRSILDEIKSKHPNLFPSDNKISKNIGTNIGNALRGYSINIDSFKKLLYLYGKTITHKIKEPRQLLITLEKSKALAEMIGIMLGDGHFNKNDYRIEVALNGVDDWEYVEYVSEFMKNIFKKTPRVDWFKDRKNAKGDEKGVVLLISSIELVKELESFGLIAGDKCKNQVSISDWIKKKKRI